MSIASPRGSSVEDRPALRTLAARMATLLSALPAKERRAARCELAGRVGDGRGPAPGSRPLYPPGSVVGEEVGRVAAGLAGLLRSTPPGRHAALWGDFAAAVGEHLRVIEFTAEWVIAEMFGP